jgi:hypothetical protein
LQGRRGHVKFLSDQMNVEKKFYVLTTNCYDNNLCRDFKIVFISKSIFFEVLTTSVLLFAWVWG